MKIITNLITLTPWGKEHMKRSTKRPPASPIIASSSLRKVFGLFCTLLLCLAAPAGHAENRRPTSVYTSVKPTDCHVPPPPLVTAYEARGLAVRECQAPKGWRLFVVSTDECSWLELSRDGLLWSTEEQVVYRNNFGNFPNLGADKVEWCLSASGSPIALIFRISAQSPTPPDNATVIKSLSKLFVIRLDDGTPQFCGVVQTNKEARELADRVSPDAHPLSQLRQP